jgi:hypothetical protein
MESRGQRHAIWHRNRRVDDAHTAVGGTGADRPGRHEARGTERDHEAQDQPLRHGVSSLLGVASVKTARRGERLSPSRRARLRAACGRFYRIESMGTAPKSVAEGACGAGLPAVPLTGRIETRDAAVGPRVLYRTAGAR